LDSRRERIRLGRHFLFTGNLKNARAISGCRHSIHSAYCVGGRVMTLRFSLPRLVKAPHERVMVGRHSSLAS
jgi:hypothetical protein